MVSAVPAVGHILNGWRWGRGASSVQAYLKIDGKGVALKIIACEGGKGTATAM